MKRVVSILFLVTLGAFFQAVAADDVPLVDIASAEAEIAQLDKDAAALTAENAKLTAEIKDLQAAIDNSQKELKEMLTLIDNSRYQRQDMVDFRASINDAKLLAKVDEALGKLDKAIATSSDRRNVINKENADRAAKIKADKEAVNLNNRSMDRQNSRKNNLLASIERTKAQDARFQRQMAKIDAFLTGAAPAPAAK
jgi:chromosome segregation ATPase